MVVVLKVKEMVGEGLGYAEGGSSPSVMESRRRFKQESDMTQFSFLKVTWVT